MAVLVLEALGDGGVESRELAQHVMVVAEAADVDALEGAAHLQESEQLHDAPGRERSVSA